MKNKKIIAVVILVLLVVGCYVLLSPKTKNSEQILTTAVVESGRIISSITATGTVEPVTLVEVGTQVSGILTSLNVDYNSIVKKGQIIAELDKSTLLVDLASKKSSLSSRKSQYEYETANYTRVKVLYDKKLISDSEYELTLYNYETAKNSYAIAKNDLVRSQTNLDYATIYSPIDGVVLSKSVEEGQTVASSFNTPTLFTIAADLTDMRVVANVDEADIGGVKVGQNVSFTVDAFPNDKFTGNVTQIRKQAIIVSNVVTYEVIISASNLELKLMPGLTASVEIYILDKQCNTIIPSKALLVAEQLRNSGMAPSSNKMGRPDKAGRAGKGNRPDVAGRSDRPDRNSGHNNKLVMVKTEDGYERKNVVVGVTNGVHVEVVGLNKGDSIVVGISSNNTNADIKSKKMSSPFMPGPGSRGKR